MKLSIWSSYYMDLSPEDAILEIEKHGYRYCELSDEHAITLMKRGDPIEVGKRFKMFAELHHITLLQGHLILQVKICESENIDLLKDQLDLFKAIGIKNAVLHCDSMEEYPDLSLEGIRNKNVTTLRILTEHIKDTDMVICLENLRDASITKSADDLLYFINEVDSKNLGICLDTGHLNLCNNRNQGEFIRKCGKHIKALHITDNEGQYDQHIMPFGLGTVNIMEVIAELKKIGYDGLYNLEIPGERWTPLVIRGYKLEYLKKVFEYLDKEWKC